MCLICKTSSYSPNIIRGRGAEEWGRCELLKQWCSHQTWHLVVHRTLHWCLFCVFRMPWWTLQLKRLHQEISRLGKSKQLWILETVYNTQLLVPRDVTSPKLLPRAPHRWIAAQWECERERIQAKDFKLNTAGGSQHLCIDFFLLCCCQRTYIL